MDAAFVTIAGLIVISALAAMTLRNLVHCALCLTMTFAGLAALYLKLNAQFVGLAQVLVNPSSRSKYTNSPVPARQHFKIPGECSRYTNSPTITGDPIPSGTCPTGASIEGRPARGCLPMLIAEC